MRNVAVILAGGIGSRMGIDLPKQFLEIKGIPVIIHTLKNFEKNPNISDILIVCESNWINYLKQVLSNYCISKVKWIIPGGKTGHDSTSNAVLFLEGKLNDNDLIIIHDAARPILPQAAINDMIEIAKDKGNASLAIPCHETVILTYDKKSGIEDLNRDTIMRVQTPQAYKASFIIPLYKQAFKECKHDFVYADLVAIYYGKRIFFSKGFTNNIKITKKEDIVLCESLMNFSENELFNS